MGRDKATLEIDGVSLLDRATATLRRAGAIETIVSLASTGFSPSSKGESMAGHRVVLDDGHGPLGGILAALESSVQPYVVVLAVDLPAVRSDTVTDLVRRCSSSDSVVVAASDGGSLRQPLLSVWRRAAVVDDVARDWKSGERSVMRLLTRRADVTWSEVPRRELLNVNEPDDLRNIGNLEAP